MLTFRIFKILFAIIFINSTLVSCSINYELRANKDINLNEASFNQLNGKYLCQDFKHAGSFDHFSKDSFSYKDFTLDVRIISKNEVKIKFLLQDTCFREYSFKGKLKKGYFKTNTKFTTVWTVGPLLWGLRRETHLLGLTKEHNLVVINSSGGNAWVLVIPLFGSGGEYYGEFKRL